MKKIVRIALVSAALGTAAHAAPFLAIGDGAELFITGTLGVRADDNIFLASKTPATPTASNQVKSDTIFDINPGAEITFGKDATMKGALTLVDAFANYSSNSKLNTQLFSGDFRVAYDDSKLKLKFNTGYHELNQNTVDNVGLTRRNEFVIAGVGESEISQIASASLGANFNHTAYHRSALYGNSDDLNIPLNFYYKWTPKTDLSVGYRYRDYKTTAPGSFDSNDNFFNIGARGEFTPMLTGTIAVGYTTRNFSGSSTSGTAAKPGNQNLPGVESSLIWTVDPKTTVQLNATNDFGTSPQGLQQKNLTLGGLVSFAIDSQWSVNGGLSWRSIDYYNKAANNLNPHTDDYIEGTIGAGYIITTNIKLNASYTYRKNSSDLAGSQFTNNVFSLAAVARY